MSDLQSLHTQARKLILTLSAGLERLESAEQVRQYKLPKQLCSLKVSKPVLNSLINHIFTTSVHAVITWPRP